MFWIALISGIVFCYGLITFLYPNTRDITTIGLTSNQLAQRKQAQRDIKRAATPGEREEILLRWLPVAEDLANNRGFGVDPWFYTELSGIYGNESKYAEELRVLQRFNRQPHTADLIAAPLLQRLSTVKQLAANRGQERLNDELQERAESTSI